MAAEAIVRILRRALAKKAEKRFESVGEMAAAVRAVRKSLASVARQAWPLHPIAANAVAATRDEVFALTGDHLERLDWRGRLIEEVDDVKEVLASDGAWLARRPTRVEVHGPEGRRALRNVPAEADLALSAQGTLAFVADGVVVVADAAGTTRSAGESGSVASGVTFVGEEQTLCVARTKGDRAWLEMGASRLALPEKVARLWGHPKRFELVAKSAADHARLHLVRLGHATATHLDCGALTSDGDSFYGCTADGALATLNVASNRVARTPWEWKLAAVAAATEGVVLATRSGRLDCLR